VNNAAMYGSDELNIYLQFQLRETIYRTAIHFRDASVKLPVSGT